MNPLGQRGLIYLIFMLGRLLWSAFSFILFRLKRTNIARLLLLLLVFFSLFLLLMNLLIKFGIWDKIQQVSFIVSHGFYLSLWFFWLTKLLEKGSIWAGKAL